MRGKELREGDYVWVIGSDGMSVAYVEIIKIIFRFYPVVYLSDRRYPVRSGRYIFKTREEAVGCLRKRLKKKIEQLEDRINMLVSEFDSLDQISPPTVITPTLKKISMGKLKPGDSVWKVRKGDKEVREVKVKKIIEEKEKYLCYKVLYIYISSSITFKAYPNSTRSLNELYYTEEKQAWKYMLKWKRSRMRTVGKEMEKLMKELEDAEEIWRLTEG